MEIVDILIKCKFIITLSELQIIENGSIAINDGVIVAVGKDDDISKKFKGEEVIIRDKHILLPGFVDCHTHTQQFLLKSSITDYYLQLPPIWTEFLIPFEEMLGNDLAYLSSLLSVALMAKNGITFFIEAGAPYPEELIKAVKQIGLKAAVTCSTFDKGYIKPQDTKSVLRKVERTLRMAKGRVKPWCSIREIMMSSRDLLDGVKDLCIKYKAGLTYHLGEYQGEVDYSISTYGLRPLEFFDKIGLTVIKPSVIAHGVFFSGTEIEILRERRVGICWCPTVDSILMAPHWLSFEHHGKDLVWGLGTDGAAFTTLDLLHEAKVARAVGKSLSIALTYNKTYPSSEILIKALTGFHGRIIGEKTGVIKEGFKADLITINLDNLPLIPVHDPLELVVSFAEGSHVYDVLVDGEFVVKNGKLTRIREEELMEKIWRVLPKIRDLVSDLKSKLGRE